MQALLGAVAPVLALALVLFASREIGVRFRRLGLPLISGFLLCGALAGPDLLGLLSRDGVERLRFLDEMAIAFIGFAAGAELYLREFRDRVRPIFWVTAGVTVATVPLVALAFLWTGGSVPGLDVIGPRGLLAAALVTGAIMVARSPSSAIAIVKELRAWGPFTRLGLGVTVIMDAVVIVLFAISVEVADVLLEGAGGIVGTVGFLVLEIGLSVALGVAIGQVLAVALRLAAGRAVSAVIVLLLGWGVFAAAHFLRDGRFAIAGHELLLEPLLMCMVAGAFVTNATAQRNELGRLLDRSSPLVFVAFFTLAGASLSLQVLARTWKVAVVLFAVRLLAILVGGLVGGLAAREPARESRLLWMSLITQAGVSLGLAKGLALEFPEWGDQVATVLIAVIVLNQLVGPPLHRWVLKAVGEAHPRADAAGFDGVRDAILFGHEGQATALARQLHEHGWNVKLAVHDGERFEGAARRGLEVHTFDQIDLETLTRLDAARAECIVSMLDDDSNYRVCELAYEHFGTANLVVRAHQPRNQRRLHDLGAVVVDPSTAMISLLDQLVRSPHSTSLLLGFEQGRGVAEIQVGNPSLDGVPLRDLVLPSDALVLSLRRGRNTIITNGNSRLRLEDWVTVLGGQDALEEVAVRFGGEARARQLYSR